MHLRGELADFVLGQTRRCSHAGNDHGAGLEQQAMLGQTRVDEGQHLRREFAFFQQVTKAQNRRLDRQAHSIIEGEETPIQQMLEQLFSHRRIAEAQPQRQAVDAKHDLYTEWQGTHEA